MKRVLRVYFAVVILVFAVGPSGCGGGNAEVKERGSELPTPTPSTPGAAAKDAELPVVAPVAAPAAATQCASDADCVPAECCHPKTCVPKAKAPNCDGMMCTEDCQDGTLDCGAGACACLEGECGVKWRES